MTKAGLKIKIFGNVQGVNFRHYAQKMALDLGLTGWVKNSFDGTVECLVEGESDSLKKFLEWCHSGPKIASVEKVEDKRLEYSGKFDSFNIVFKL